MRLFGAKIKAPVIFIPLQNMVPMEFKYEKSSTIADYVNIYNVDYVSIGESSQPLVNIQIYVLISHESD